MASRRSVLERPSTHEKVVKLVLEGLSDADIAAALAEKHISVTRQAITAFRHRHADVLGPAKAAAVEQTVDLWIASEVERRKKRQELYEETDTRRRELPERAGMTYAAMVREQRSILDAEEPKTPSTVNNIDARTQVLIHQVRGAEVELG